MTLVDFCGGCQLQQFNYSPAKGPLNIMQRLPRRSLTYPEPVQASEGRGCPPPTKDVKACSIGPYKMLAGRLVNQPLP